MQSEGRPCANRNGLLTTIVMEARQMAKPTLSIVSDSVQPDTVRQLAARGLSTHTIAARTGLDPQCIDAVLRGAPWRHLTQPRASNDLFPRPPIRQRNAERRSREYLTPSEVERLISTAKKRGRHGQRDATAILVAYTHGLRVSELVGLTWSQIDFAEGVIHVKRLKNGRPSTQPLRGQEIRQLRQLKREWPESQFVLQSERGGPWTDSGFRKTLMRIGVEAGFPWLVHPHQLRHATG
jgi:integrase